MIVHPMSDEILERLWVCREDGIVIREAADLAVGTDDERITAAIEGLASARAIRTAPRFELLAGGEERARAVIRRHRLAEILFAEVLEADMQDAEASACELEHMLTERVVDRVCAFLGHPPKCPHGKPIPRGSCCSVYERHVEPLVSRLADLEIGATATVVFITPKSTSRLSRLAAFGVIPSSEVRLLQRKPSFVIRTGETSIAIEDDMAREIFVRPQGRAG